MGAGQARLWGGHLGAALVGFVLGLAARAGAGASADAAAGSRGKRWQ